MIGVNMMKRVFLLLTLLMLFFTSACDDTGVEVRIANYSLQNLNTVEVGGEDYGPLSSGLTSDYRDFDEGNLSFIITTSLETLQDELKGLKDGSKYTLNIFPFLVWTVTEDTE